MRAFNNFDVNDGASTSAAHQIGRGITEEERDGEFLPTIEIINEERNVNSELRYNRIRVRTRFLNPPNRDSVSIENFNNILKNWLDRTFTTLLNTVESRLNIRPHDKVGIMFTRNEHDSFGLSFRQFDQYTSDLIISHISRVLQSNSEFLFDENLSVDVTQIPMDVGFGKRRYLEGASIENFAKAHNRSVFLLTPMQGRETLCLAYAIVLGIAHINRDQNLFDKLLHFSNIDFFTEQALQLCEKANVDLSHGGTLEEVHRFQKYFGNKLNLIIFKDRKGREIFYRGHKKSTIQKLFLLLEDEHYLLVINIHAAFSVNYYCDDCLKSSVSALTHKNCPYTCRHCFEKPPCATVEKK